MHGCLCSEGHPVGGCRSYVKGGPEANLHSTGTCHKALHGCGIWHRSWDGRGGHGWSAASCTCVQTRRLFLLHKLLMQVLQHHPPKLLAGTRLRHCLHSFQRVTHDWVALRCLRADKVIALCSKQCDSKPIQASVRLIDTFFWPANSHGRGCSNEPHPSDAPAHTALSMIVMSILQHHSWKFVLISGFAPFLSCSAWFLCLG